MEGENGMYRCGVSHYSFPLGRGDCLGMEMIPRLRVTITSGEWPPQRDSGHKQGTVTITGGGWLSPIESDHH